MFSGVSPLSNQAKLFCHGDSGSHVFFSKCIFAKANGADSQDRERSNIQSGAVALFPFE
jgi:hypothetical protein